MANQIKLNVNKIELDENENTIHNVTESLIESFTKKSVGAFTISANSTYKSISFGEVETAVVVILESDEDLKVKINSGTEEFTTKTAYLRGAFTALEIRNDSENDSEINYEVYGS
jgi:hypothetical protein